MAVRKLLTIGELARRLNVETHQVKHILRTRGIQPLGRAGIANVYAESTVATIAGVLAERVQQPRRMVQPMEPDAPQARIGA